MERTYNTFIDNGLFVAAYYLDKPIEDITTQDLNDNIDMFVGLMMNYINSEKLKQVVSTGFNNSPLANPSIKDKKSASTNLLKTLLEFNTEKGDVCMFCGKPHVNIDLMKYSTFSSSINPLISANTFYNFANNLKIVNVCPMCQYLMLLSMFNTKKYGHNVLICSDNDEFMYDYTKETQIQNAANMISNTKKDKENLLDFVLNLFDEDFGQKEIYNCNYIEIIKYNNCKQIIIEEYSLNKKYINLIKIIQEEGLFNEFKSLKLVNSIIKQNLSNVYLNYLIDFKEEKYRCSKELFNIIHEEMCKLNKDTLELIKNVCKKILTFNTKDSIRQLKDVKTLNNYQSLLIKWQEGYMEVNETPLFSLEDFDKLTNYIKYKQIINYMICELIINKNEGV